MHKLQLLYDNGIMFSVEAYFDIGFTFYLGDRFNGIANWKSFSKFDDGVNWLFEEALKKSEKLQEVVKSL